MRIAVVTGLGLLLLATVGCAGTTAGGRSTSDPRVRSFAGQVPPALAADGTWLNVAAPTSLAAQRGRVVYVQFAFPT
jgi:hypothetical protein